MQGHIPYVPYLRAPFYVWVGRVRQVQSTAAESKVEAPATFPPTFLYTMSWEDPRPDMEVCSLLFCSTFDLQSFRLRLQMFRFEINGGFCIAAVIPFHGFY